MSDKDNTLTIQQFKAWLEGVEEMQEEGWTPSKAQWTKIRAKIAKLCECMENQPIAQRQHYSMKPTPVNNSTIGGMSGQINFPTHNPRPLDNINPQTVTHQSALEQEIAAPTPSTQSGSSTIGPAVKTPNIDTTDGNYQSSFE